VSIDGGWEYDKNEMHWICEDNTMLWINYAEMFCLHCCDTHNSFNKCVWDILGAPEIWGCCCELHPGRVGLFGSFPKEAV
jgi:hypothetical protein